MHSTVERRVGAKGASATVESAISAVLGASRATHGQKKGDTKASNPTKIEVLTNSPLAFGA